MSALLRFLTSPQAADVLRAIGAIGAAIAAYLGVRNRGELRNGLGVIRPRRGAHSHKVSRRASARKADKAQTSEDKRLIEEGNLGDLPLRALIEAMVAYQRGVDERMEKLEHELVDINEHGSKQIRELKPLLEKVLAANGGAA